MVMHVMRTHNYCVLLCCAVLIASVRFLYCAVLLVLHCPVNGRVSLVSPGVALFADVLEVASGFPLCLKKAARPGG